VDALKVDLFPQEKYTQLFRLNEGMPFIKSNMENAGNHVHARGLPYLETSTE
jgi:hypothetical protein